MDQLIDEPRAEVLKSFDLMASVDMLQFDLQRFGRVLPETRQRVADEELSLMAEGVERAARPTFTLQRQDGELVYFDKGNWRSYTSMLYTGKRVAEAEANADNRREFLRTWAYRDIEMGYRMQALQPGEQLVWHNSYPFEVENRYGAKFIEDCGLFPERQMGFIYRATCNEEGDILLESQTVDRSDADGFAASMEMAETDPNAEMDDLVRAYDDILLGKYGGRFYAGRRNAEIHEDAWREIERHQDLMTYFLDHLEVLAASELPRTLLKKQVIQHVVGCWKAFKTRLEQNMQPLARLDVVHTSAVETSAMHIQQHLAMEVMIGFQTALRNNEVKNGCGGSIRLSMEDWDQVDGLETFKAIFGPERSSEPDEVNEDQYGSLTFHCPDGHFNRRPPGKLLDKCQHKGCKAQVKC